MFLTKIANIETSICVGAFKNVSVKSWVMTSVVFEMAFWHPSSYSSYYVIARAPWGKTHPPGSTKNTILRFKGVFQTGQDYYKNAVAAYKHKHFLIIQGVLTSEHVYYWEIPSQ